MKEQEPLIPLTPGERLRQARESRGLERADIVQALRCDPAFIVALEEGSKSKLAPVYQRGFAKRYASMVGLEAWHVEQLLAGIDTEAPSLRPVFDKPPPVQATDRWLRASTYVLASLLVGTLAWQITHEAVRLSQSESAPSTAQATEAGEGVAEPTASHVNASIAALESLGQIGKERPGGVGTEAWAALDRARQPGEQGEPGATSLREGEHLLDLSTSADSWVEIRDRDGTLLEQDLVRGGSARQYRGFGPYRITLGRTSAVQLNLDGEPVVLTSSPGDDVTQMALDPESADALPAPSGDG